jgi:hypothetical protein
VNGVASSGMKSLPTFVIGLALLSGGQPDGAAPKTASRPPDQPVKARLRKIEASEQLSSSLCGV